MATYVDNAECQNAINISKCLLSISVLMLPQTSNKEITDPDQSANHTLSSTPWINSHSFLVSQFPYLARLLSLVADTQWGGGAWEEQERNPYKGEEMNSKKQTNFPLKAKNSNHFSSNDPSTPQILPHNYMWKSLAN